MSEDLFQILRGDALGMPEAMEEFPWGESAIKVKAKTFLFLHHDGDGLSMTIKLPISRDFAEVFDFTSPAGYGLGRSGWITCRFAPHDEPDIDLLKRWIRESYRAVAPKKLAGLVPE